MGSLSAGLCKSLIDYLFTAAAYSPPTAVYVSLHTADPLETGVNEIVYDGYSVRPQVNFLAATNRMVKQVNSSIAFPTCSGTGDTATHYGIWSESTGGVFLGGGALLAPLLIVFGNTPKIYAGAIEISLVAGPGADGDANISTYLTNKLLDLVFRNQAYDKPTIAIALTTTVCTDTTFGTEVTGGSYARLTGVAWTTAQTATGATAENTTRVVFSPNPTSGWGTVTTVAIMEGASGNMLFYGNDVVNQEINTAEEVGFNASALIVGIQ